jgi:hypothetical protein
MSTETISFSDTLAIGPKQVSVQDSVAIQSERLIEDACAFDCTTLELIRLRVSVIRFRAFAQYLES